MATFVPTAALPTNGQRTLPRDAYLSDAVHAQELERIFRRRWLCVGRAAELARPGEYVLREVAGESLILVRDRDGVARAHFNVCRHRGTRLCTEAHGTLGATIQCPYHAWTYALDGRLVGVPSEDALDGLDRAAFGLHQAALVEWEGFLFVNLAERPEPFEQAYAPLLGRWAAWNLPSLVALRRIDYDVAANWKLLFENYSECYHCSPLHPSLVRLSPSDSGENDLVDGPFLGGFMVVSRAGGSLSLSGNTCGLPVGAFDAEAAQRVWYYSVFPNMLLSLHHDYVMVHTLWPAGPARTRITCEFLFHPDVASRPDLDPDDGVAFWDRTNREDWHVCELTQQGVSSSRYVPGPYSRRESLSAAWDREYLRAMQG
ncbi:MAG: aromatic ring-hydroxylating dioxygenase subunit alpha [Gemmatimonadales bacterium]|nr:aromatic ring-hydroxylating dioxygenase subunit alpha [Gemmatimonadales bacterium]